MFILRRGLAFLDEEQDDLVVTDEPERPRRRVGGPREATSAISRPTPDRRRHRPRLPDPDRDRVPGLPRGTLRPGAPQLRLGRRDDHAAVGAERQGLLQPAQRLEQHLQLTRRPAGGPRQRDTSQTLLDRAHDISTPGKMHDAQNAVIQTLTLRRDALSSIAESVPQATARTQTGQCGRDDQQRDGLAVRQRCPLDADRQA